MANLSSIGYVPRNTFNGDPESYELWEIKFLSYLRIRKLGGIVDSETAIDQTQNAEVFAELVQLLDDRSLSLIIREAKDKGNEAIQILRQHYLGKSKPRIISLYTELTSLKLGSEETVTDYIIKAEKTSTYLKNAGETIGDGLLVAMLMKGLPNEYRTFCTVITQREKIVTFSEFKNALRSFEESEIVKSNDGNKSDYNNVMKMNDSVKNGSHKIICYGCGQPGHKKYQCKQNGSGNQKSKFCSNCKMNNHNTKDCRRSNAAAKSIKNNNSDDHSFAFQVCENKRASVLKSLLVDCGATSHIVTDKSKFLNFDPNFDSGNHCIELADGSRSTGVVQGKGDVCVSLSDSKGDCQNVVLKDTLFIPSYKQDIFSVRAATTKGCSVSFDPNGSQLKSPDNETTFEIFEEGRMYYLYNNSNTKTNKCSMKVWHQILGHCNIEDVSKLQNCVDGMIIDDKVINPNCSVCTLGKMPQFISRTPDKRATKPLELVHTDLSGPITPTAKDGFKYAISFVDDFSGIINVYFLKNKSDAAKAFKIYIAEVSCYGTIERIRSDNGTEYTSNDFQSVILENKIKHELSCPYSPASERHSGKELAHYL